MIFNLSAMLHSRKSLVIGLLGAVLGCTLFAVDSIVERLGAPYANVHFWIEIIEFSLVGPGLGALCLLMAERVLTLRETARLQREFEQERRFQMLGRMAASVAHEVRNPLHSLRLVVDELRLENPELQTHPLAKHLDNCLERIDRAVTLVYQLARHKINDDSNDDLVAVLRESLTSIRQQKPTHILEHNALPERAVVKASTAALRIMVDNLLRNAIEATAEGTTISISLHLASQHWILKIINPGHVTHHQEYSESNKATGLGLGLIITRQLVENAGGQVNLSSAENRVTAELILPIGIKS